MLDDSYYWKEYNDGRACLFSVDKHMIAFIEKKDDIWYCKIYPELISEDFYFPLVSSIEEIEWQVTLHINSKCNKIANQLHKIRDHLPSIHELAEKCGRI